MNNQNKNKEFKKLFNLNTILSAIINYAAYIILVISAAAMLYLSFVQKFEIKIDLLTLSIFSVTLVALSWINWTTFYKRQYEKVMADDIEQHEKNKYSIHVRYYNAIKDYTDIELQKDIDKFNDEYTAKWLRWVEKTTGFPIESGYQVELDKDGKPIIEDGKPKLIFVKGIKDLPYKGFKHKILMWRIKTHHYPQSGYRTSMELMSLFAFQEANLNKRDLRADKRYYTTHSIQKFFSTLLTVVCGASVIPEMISGEWWTAVLKLILGIFSIGMSVIFGAINGIQGARLKLSSVEEACGDLERWADKKPILAPYSDIEQKTESEPTKEETKSTEITENIFNINLPK